MSLVQASQRMVLRFGETMTLGRATETTTIDLKGKRVTGGLDQMGNTSAQQRFHVRIRPTEIDASGWSSKAPARHDTLMVGGRTRTVDDVRPLLVGETVALYELEVVG